MDATNFGWTSVRPESDEERFGMRSKERQAAFDKIEAERSTIEIDRVLWAFFQFARLDFVKALAASDAFWNAETDFLRTNAAIDAVRLWQQKPEAKNDVAFSNVVAPVSRPHTASGKASRTRSGRSEGGQEASLGGSAVVAARCKDRDGNLCAVSRTKGAEAAHIYPWSAFREKRPERVKMFWNTLRLFWKTEDVDAWSGQIFVDDNASSRGTETVANMISLTSTLHTFHTQGAFALRPVQMSDDKTQLELEFHWLIIERRERGAKAKLMDMPESSEDRTESGDGYGPFARRDPNGSQLLKSGHRFIMSTDDPVNKPLPDPGLLALQWHLQRILAMWGAAGWRDEAFDGDGDGDDDADGAPARDVDGWIRQLPESPSGYQSPPASGQRRQDSFLPSPMSPTSSNPFLRRPDTSARRRTVNPGDTHNTQNEKPSETG